MQLPIWGSPQKRSDRSHFQKISLCINSIYRTLRVWVCGCVVHAHECVGVQQRPGQAIRYLPPSLYTLREGLSQNWKLMPARLAAKHARGHMVGSLWGLQAVPSFLHGGCGFELRNPCLHNKCSHPLNYLLSSYTIYWE